VIAGRWALSPGAFFQLVRLAGRAEKVNQRLKLRIGQVAELLLMAIAHWLIELLQQRQARLRDGDLHHAAVVGHSPPRNETTLFEPIDQARDVGCVRNELSGKDQRRQRPGMLGSQEAQGVVLLSREIVPQKQFVFEHAQPIIRSPEVEITLLLGRIEAARRAAGGSGRHEGSLLG
jgi:hypothetical protein